MLFVTYVFVHVLLWSLFCNHTFIEYRTHHEFIFTDVPTALTAQAAAIPCQLERQVSQFQIQMIQEKLLLKKSTTWHVAFVDGPPEM